MTFSKASSQLRDETQVSRIVGESFTTWDTRETQEYWSEQPIPSSGDHPNPGTELGSPALQTDSLPAELPGKLQWESTSIMLYFILWNQSLCSYW